MSAVKIGRRETSGLSAVTSVDFSHVTEICNEKCNEGLTILTILTLICIWSLLFSRPQKQAVLINREI
jgi:hypothetical protein